MIARDVLEFIERRFKQDCNWKTDNCYYFASILMEQFKSYDHIWTSRISRDVIL